ncbi:MAG: Signal recognition particle subunit SEC65 [Candidatus Alkanophagales archaeon MCA70_species_1]|nr:Signal recognition particle subunit SEC65 [Candidatus Alkanophaga volatiphilum]
MVAKAADGKIVIWPAYLDATKPKSRGRKISRAKAVKSPRLSEIVEAARKLGLNPVVEEEKAFPSSWWEFSGRVLVDKKGSKTELLQRIAELIKEAREKKARAKQKK